MFFSLRYISITKLLNLTANCTDTDHTLILEWKRQTRNIIENIPIFPAHFKNDLHFYRSLHGYNITFNYTYLTNITKLWQNNKNGVTVKKEFSFFFGGRRGMIPFSLLSSNILKTIIVKLKIRINKGTYSFSFISIFGH